jgi:molybdate transport system ATP-binding protein
MSADARLGAQGLDATLVKRLGRFTLSVHIQCAPGELTALVGPSGSGKTTVLRCLAGLDAPDSGRVALGDGLWEDTERGVRLSPQARGVGLLTQDYALFPHMTVLQNVAFAMTGTGDPGELLGAFGVGHLRNKKPCEISGGERQRAALCQTLARRPGLLLLDEPFSALDVENRMALRERIMDIKRTWDIPILHVTHDLADALVMADRIISLKNGRRDDDWLARQKELMASEQAILFGGDFGRAPQSARM